jgi:hypothetical protein
MLSTECPAPDSRGQHVSNDPRLTAKLREIVGHRALDRLNPLTSLW